MLKKILFVMLVALFAVGIASAQQLKGDILGPHNVNGHGCASCHAPHSGAKGNGGTSTATGTFIRRRIPDGPAIPSLSPPATPQPTRNSIRQPACPAMMATRRP